MIKSVEDLSPVEIKPVRGMFHYEFLPQGQTVDQHVYNKSCNAFFAQ